MSDNSTVGASPLSIIENIEAEREKSTELSVKLISDLMSYLNKFINTFKGFTHYIKTEILRPIKNDDHDTYEYYSIRLKEYSKMISTMEKCYNTINDTVVNSGNVTYKGSELCNFIEAYGTNVAPFTEQFRLHDITLFDVNVFTPFKMNPMIIPNTHLDFTVLWSDRQLKITDTHKRKVLVYLGLLQKLQDNCSKAYNAITLEAEYQNARGDEMITVGSNALNELINANITEGKDEVQYFTNLLIDELKKERIAPTTVLNKMT